MKDRYEIDFSDNPVFNTVIGLTNTTLDLENIVINRGATEGQLRELYDLLISLQTQINECCAQDHSQGTTDNILARLNDLEARIEGCCYEHSSPPSGDPIHSGCDGNVITVSANFTSANQGKATAISSIAGRNIVGYHFLVQQENGIYYKSSTGRSALDFGWSIGADGTMVGSASTRGPWTWMIVATDDHGCEGTTYVNLPGGPIVGG